MDVRGAFCHAVLVSLLLVSVHACSDDTAPGTPSEDTSVDGGVPDTLQDSGGGEDSGQPPGDAVEDTSDTTPPTPSYPEWFQTPCADNDDCVDEEGNTGWCVQINADGEKQCTVDCQTECPPGYGCVAIQNRGGSDGLLVCMPNNPVSCNECVADEDCIYQGARCLQVGFVDGTADYRCVESCADTEGVCGDSDNYDCELTVVEEGASPEPLCVPKTKSCVCFGQDDEGNEIDGSYRTCSDVNEFGTCIGNEQCDGENGWTGCTAMTPLEEVCDGLDNDCDEATDEELEEIECTVENAFGSCVGVESCQGADGWLCDAQTPAEELCDGIDNDCDLSTDEEQLDTDDDGTCDGLDDDDDNDTIPDETDNCPFVANQNQTDTDGNGQGDACDGDQDSDGVPNEQDNCPLIQNLEQDDFDEDNIGDACDPDADGDGKNVGEGSDCNDSNPLIYDGAPELCDGLDNNCNNQIDEGFPDNDADNAADCVDADDDNDTYPDACDPTNAACVVDCAPLDTEVNPGAPEICDGIDNNCDEATDEGFDDFDLDGQADCVDEDLDGDGVANEEDNCVSTPNGGQENNDPDGFGDACDSDDDNDNVLDDEDNCPTVPNQDQTNLDGDGLGDACDTDKDGDGQVDINLPGGVDCNDADVDVFDGNEEVCDGKDNDCNDLIDEGFVDTDDDDLKDCVDTDDDGDLDPDNSDCDPLDDTIFTGADELCDGKDNNCDLQTDEGCPPTSVDVIFTSAVVTGTTADGLSLMLSVGLPGVIGTSEPAGGDGFAVDWGFYHTLP